MKRLLLLAVLTAVPALPEAGTVDVKGSLGGVGFLDESFENHTLVGGSVRAYITRRLSIEPEFLYLRQNANHYDIAFLPHVNFDLLTGRVAPYLSFGVGAMRSTFKGFESPFNSTEVFFEGGGGAKLYVTDRFFVAPEFKLGWEPHVRFSVGVGYSFGR